MNYYNEYEPFAVEWLKELIKDGLIPAGDVDSRSIAEVEPSDLIDYKQCHFFAGIGGWAYAARLAGWKDDRPMWTGSPPCQPFSTAGKQSGTADERHLWPVWFNLLRQCKPPIIFGEQVSAAITHGWLDALQADLESCDYACGSIIIPANVIGAFHRRDRLWFVAQSNETQCTREWLSSRTSAQYDTTGSYESHCQLADTISKRCTESGRLRQQFGKTQTADRQVNRAINDGASGSMAYTNNAEQYSGSRTIQQDNRNHSGWCGAGIKPILCRDNKIRYISTEPEVFPLAHGIPNRMGILRGAGNAIVPQVAAEIIKVFV